MEMMEEEAKKMGEVASREGAGDNEELEHEVGGEGVDAERRVDMEEEPLFEVEDGGELAIATIRGMTERMESGEKPADEDWIRKGSEYVAVREMGKMLEEAEREWEENKEMNEWCEKVDKYMTEKMEEEGEDDVGEELWKVSRSAKRVAEEEAAEKRKMVLRVRECARCPVCGKKVRGAIFGRKMRGVWVGCDRSPECARNIELHLEGWSFEEVCDEWDRKNRGLNRMIRKMKMWWENWFGEKRRREKEMRRQRLERERRNREELKEVMMREKRELEGVEVE